MPYMHAYIHVTYAGDGWLEIRGLLEASGAFFAIHEES
jgi:hypothetical protein